MFRISRSAVVQNIELDMTGFREAILIKGGSNVCPVLQHCSIRCAKHLNSADVLHAAGSCLTVDPQCLLTQGYILFHLCTGS